MTEWHRSEIKAAVEKRGTTFTGLALSNGLNHSACRHAVHGRNIGGEQAISQFIDVPLWELWPDRWRKPADDNSPPQRIDTRRKSQTWENDR